MGKKTKKREKEKRERKKKGVKTTRRNPRYSWPHANPTIKTWLFNNERNMTEEVYYLLSSLKKELDKVENDNQVVFFRDRWIWNNDEE